MNGYFKFALILFFGLLAAAFFIFFQNISEAAILEKKLLSKMRSENNCNGVVKVSEIIPAKYSDLCFQGPYMGKADFEKIIGRSIDGYEMAYDDLAYWWFLGLNNNYFSIPIKRSEFLENTNPPGSGHCSSVSKVSIHFSCKNGKTQYLFKEE